MLLLLGLLSPGAARAQAAPGFDCEALYESGDYTAAIQCLQTLESQGNHNGHLLYNLGNAWLREGNTGQAVLAYRRALLFLPRDGDLRANLKTARERARDDLEPADVRGPLARTLLAPYDSLSSSELLLLGAAAWALCFLLLTIRRLRQAEGLGAVAAGLALIAVLGLAGHFVRSYQQEARPIVVVLAEEVTLRSGRDLRSVELARLHAGAELKALEQGSDWIQVLLSSGQRGWLPASELGLVRPITQAEQR
tara:strand:- start:601 stop:1356 length:756 start_codon:yes stop_codon:yes gene_type:complete